MKQYLSFIAVHCLFQYTEVFSWTRTDAEMKPRKEMMWFRRDTLGSTTGTALRFLQPGSASQRFLLPSAQMLLYSGASECQWRLRKHINQEVLRTSLKAHTKFKAHSSNTTFGLRHFSTTSIIACLRTIAAFCNAYTFAHQSIIKKQEYRTFN